MDRVAGEHHGLGAKLLDSVEELRRGLIVCYGPELPPAPLGPSETEVDIGDHERTARLDPQPAACVRVEARPELEEASGHALVKILTEWEGRGAAHKCL